MSNATQKLTELLNNSHDIDGKDREVLEIMLKVLIEKALKGDIKALTLILERLEGKPTQDININGDDKASTLQEINERLSEFIESRQSDGIQESSED